MVLFTLASLVAVTTVKGHGAVISPPPRNGVDRDLKPWNGPAPCKGVKGCPSVETQTGFVPPFLLFFFFFLSSSSSSTGLLPMAVRMMINQPNQASWTWCVGCGLPYQTKKPKIEVLRCF